MIVISGSSVVVEPPPTPDAPPPVAAGPELHALNLRWTSWTGEQWYLSNYTGDEASPVIVLDGVGGLGGQDPEHWWQDSPTLDGSSWDGLRIPRGETWLKLMVSAADSPTFIEEHRRFRRSLNPREEGVLRVTHPDATWREQALRYVSGKDEALERDPVFDARATYVITWAAADPFWHGPPVVETFPYAGDSPPMLPGPPFRLTPSQILGEGTTDNPGDVDSFPIWRMDGPFTGFTCGVGSSVVTATLTKGAGQWVEIDMRPNKLTVTDEAGVDRWSSLTEVEMVPIPPGPSELATTLLGAGPGSNVTLSFTPRYEGAF